MNEQIKRLKQQLAHRKAKLSNITWSKRRKFRHSWPGKNTQKKETKKKVVKEQRKKAEGEAYQEEGFGIKEEDEVSSSEHDKDPKMCASRRSASSLLRIRHKSGVGISIPIHKGHPP